MSLFLYFLAYFLLAYVWHSVLVYKRTGRNPFVLSIADNAHGYVGRVFTMVFVFVGCIVTAQAFYPEAKTWMLPISALDTAAFKLGGWILMVAALVWLVVAEAQMGSSWRIGFDTQHSTSLVSSGLFGVSRNPVFLGMRVNLLGLFCVLPTAATACALVVGEVVIQIQVRLEEEFLLAQHGDPYRHYKSRVRRWL